MEVLKNPDRWLVPTEFGVDHLIRRRYRHERPVFGDGLAMKGDNIRRAQPQESFDPEDQDTDVVQLTDDRDEVGQEVERRQDIRDRGERHGLEIGRDRWLSQEPQREVNVGEQCSNRP